METLVYGFYLVMVTITPSGDIKGEVLNHFADPIDCVVEGQWEEETSEFGVGFVCIEDVVE